jgi:succinate dehydrogenase/fumarate reductase flavoprotein subunit
MALPRVLSTSVLVIGAGGINAVLGTMDPDDTWQQHAADTIANAYFLADPAVVETVVRNAPRAIDELVAWGLPFAREADGRLSQRFFGSHTYRRTCFAGDYTGLEIQRTLLRAAEAGVRIVDTLYVSRLLAATSTSDASPPIRSWAIPAPHRIMSRTAPRRRPAPRPPAHGEARQIAVTAGV